MSNCCIFHILIKDIFYIYMYCDALFIGVCRIKVERWSLEVVLEHPSIGVYAPRKGKINYTLLLDIVLCKRVPVDYLGNN